MRARVVCTPDPVVACKKRGRLIFQANNLRAGFQANSLRGELFKGSAIPPTPYVRQPVFSTCFFNLFFRPVFSTCFSATFAFDRCGLFLGRIDQMIKKRRRATKNDVHDGRLRRLRGRLRRLRGRLRRLRGRLRWRRRRPRWLRWSTCGSAVGKKK